MEELLKIITPILPIAGIVVGAAIQSFYSRRAENKKQVLLSKTQAYVDYLECISESAQLKSRDGKEINQLFAKAANAKSRICVYGSNDVISALAKFEDVGAAINSEENANVFIKLCAAMREDHLQEKNTASIKELESILVGNRKW